MANEFYDGVPSEFPTPPKQHDKQETTSLVQQLSPQKHLREIMMWLNGKLYNEETGEYEEIEGAKPFMNKEGNDMFFHYATSIISPIVTMSNYRADTKMIHKLVLMNIKDAIIHFHLHYQDYGITRKTKIRILTNKLTTLGLSAFYKALGGGDRKASTSNISESINTLSRQGFNNEQPIKSSGVFSKMNPFKNY